MGNWELYLEKKRLRSPVKTIFFNSDRFQPSLCPAFVYRTVTFMYRDTSLESTLHTNSLAKTNLQFSLFHSFFLPTQKHRKDVANFDREFTIENPTLTPTDKLFIMNLDQKEFSGFSYVNPEFIVDVWRRTAADAADDRVLREFKKKRCTPFNYW